ncbi:MocR-like pyridoxine biosynthesis transcription factor PdxR [Tabrizicola oligotrophica]|uniref:PLP-dependent aminotransferase family protein n=1 Tax=Tabrizicola oligotrophica TaxID=2710650 RepID=A0A6M0QXT2_9RHOB|nr:PLP-dependent aminotransferase family protein [Tabrizicola oligotrophica]NEY91564.1 PLP-dependent aminotransferase family protein [Tabrizicola oligotrophica]
MAKRKSGALLTTIAIDRDSRTPLFRQIEDQLRGRILAGSLSGGTRLPASRALAADLGVSRQTVVQVLESLAAEGFLEMRRGSGTFVAATFPAHVPQRFRSQPEPGPDSAIAPRVSGLGSRFGAAEVDFIARENRPFLPNSPAYDQFPFALWQKYVNRQTRQAYRGTMGYGDPAGYAPLRHAIADYLALHRSDACDPEQIVITPGGHAAFMIAALLLTEPGDGLLFEDPGPMIARNLFEALGRKLVHVPVDDDGMDFEDAIAHGGGERLAFVMPSRQHPLGRTMSLARRLRLLDWANSTDAWILEDDYDSEFRYTGRPLPSIRSIDRSGRVIYVGTFSKALFPALRLGYLVLPPALVSMFRNAIALMVRSVPLATQMALAGFIADGHFASHLRRMRELYAERRQGFLQAATRSGSGLYQVEMPDSGMNAIAWLPGGQDDRETARRAVLAGVHGYPLGDYCVRPLPRPGLLLGFTGVAPHQLGPGLDALAQLLADPAMRRP